MTKNRYISITPQLIKNGNKIRQTEMPVTRVTRYPDLSGKTPDFSSIS